MLKVAMRAITISVKHAAILSLLFIVNVRVKELTNGTREVVRVERIAFEA